MNEAGAFELFAAELPEFTPCDYGSRGDGGPLFHLVMADLYRFHGRVGEQPEIESRYWAVIERLAAEGSDEVENAVAVSLIEHFAGEPQSTLRFRQARPLQGFATHRLAAGFGL